MKKKIQDLGGFSEKEAREIISLAKKNPNSFAYEIDKMKGMRIFDPFQLFPSREFRTPDGWTEWSLA